jgi:hypothetical protein
LEFESLVPMLSTTDYPAYQNSNSGEGNLPFYTHLPSMFSFIYLFFSGSMFKTIFFLRELAYPL